MDRAEDQEERYLAMEAWAEAAGQRLVRAPSLAFARHVPPAGQKAVVVDHHTRSLRVDGTPWQGSGWYIFSGWLCDGHANAPPFDWAPGNGAGSFIDQVRCNSVLIRF